ncbi:NDP-hexose 2,3-dehydratase family protein [Streptacidiphilus sp. ASG 303]|uniref:NDP-hexose 2,3-dehydratase family protein n=1 Tax=Streptacidiphilus sp. ASG 303 TaxID=2896847 RepID=UPI001E514BFD|nr:NDP-hexose 2,3-dehydratase family protein [Streptacidiphilus sp. ASG 303]MCD0485133.1 NDP-hexose 2,3-dehydratase family protein [Streptacidiphilus sp. ASG 303]
MSSSPPRLRQRADTELADRFARSAAADRGSWLRTEDFADWLAGRGRANRFGIERIPFAELDGWSFEEGTGNLVHRSGRFFTVEGLHVTTGAGPYPEWHQPIIKQPEVGILGILVKEFDGVLHFLMQAKMEPGNPNLLQLSPTVQATRSNYTKVHRGADVKYIQYFTGPGRGRVLADVLQSEHGSWFHQKSNRNMIVEVEEDVPLEDDFCWLTLGQLGRLLHRDNVVNMDSRTVLSCIPLDGPGEALHSDTELLSWFTGRRSAHDVHAERVPLAGLPGWTRGESAISHHEGRWFDVVAVRVEAGNREVTGWTQPLIEPRGRGVAAFLARRVDGVLHLLAHAKVEGGFLDTVELAPTVQCTPGNHDGLAPADRPPFLDRVLAARPGQIRYDTVHSEEGGRFLNAESRYLVVELEDGEDVEVPDDYAWVTPAQLSALLRHGHYVNVQARTLVACLHALGQAAHG